MDYKGTLYNEFMSKREYSDMLLERKHKRKEQQISDIESKFDCKVLYSICIDDKNLYFTENYHIQEEGMSRFSNDLVWYGCKCNSPGNSKTCGPYRGNQVVLVPRR
jgi:hypothetical protein